MGLLKHWKDRLKEQIVAPESSEAQLKSEVNKEVLNAIKRKAATVVAKGNVALTKAKLCEMVVKEHLDTVTDRLDSAANVGDQRKYVLLYPRRQRLTQQLAAVQDMRRHTEEMMVETEVVGMMHEGLVDSIAVQEKYFETLETFAEIAEMNPGLLEEYEQNMCKITEKRSTLDKTIKRMRSIATAFQEWSLSPPREAVEAFKKHRKDLGLPP